MGYFGFFTTIYTMKKITHNATVFKTILKELGKEANEKFPTLNMGGCCVFAAEVARRLQKRGVEQVEVIASAVNPSTATPLDMIRTDLLNNNKSPLERYNWDAMGASFMHVAVRFCLNGKWYTYDSDILRCSRTSFGRPSYEARRGAHTVDEAIAFANDESGWNSTFNRKQIPAVKRLIAQYLG